MRKALQEFGADDARPADYPRGWEAFARHLFSVPGDAATPDGVAHLQQWLQAAEKGSAAARLYYLAVDPERAPA